MNQAYAFLKPSPDTWRDKPLTIELQKTEEPVYGVAKQASQLLREGKTLAPVKIHYTCSRFEFPQEKNPYLVFPPNPSQDPTSTSLVKNPKYPFRISIEDRLDPDSQEPHTAGPVHDSWIAASSSDCPFRCYKGTPIPRPPYNDKEVRLIFSAALELDFKTPVQASLWLLDVLGVMQGIPHSKPPALRSESPGVEPLAKWMKPWIVASAVVRATQTVDSDEKKAAEALDEFEEEDDTDLSRWPWS